MNVPPQDVAMSQKALPPNLVILWVGVPISGFWGLIQSRTVNSLCSLR